MMRRYYLLILSAVMASALSSCSTEDERTTDPYQVYNALWEVLDERYAYFDLKLPPDSSWRDMYHKHYLKLRAGMTTDSLFSVLTDLMAELKDGHVNLATAFDYGRYWNWYEDYPSNYDSRTADLYLGKDYRIAGGLRYTMIKHNGHTADSIGYLRFGSFASGLSQSNLSASLSRLARCKGLVIDIRDNGGGNVTTSDLFARHFLDESRLVGYTRHKTGKGHNDFSPLTPITLSPIDNSVRWLRPVILLTNRAVYSAANDFVMRMKDNPFVIVMGDRTGGGGGLPMTSELPNGWLIRFSSTQTLDAQKQHVEHGIDPHYQVELLEADLGAGRDTMIEAAIAMIKDRLQQYKETKHWKK